MSDTDIDFMDPGDAREYVLNFILSLKRTQKDRAVADEELEQWQRRVKLAEARGEPLLKRSAEGRVAELKARSQQLLEEERQLRAKVDVLKEKLRALSVRSSLRVDTDAQLEQQLQELEAQQALEELKRKLGEEQS